MSCSVQREMLNAVHEIFRFGTFRNEFEVLNTAANGDTELMRVNQSCEILAAVLTFCGFGQKIFVPAEHHTAKFTGAVQQVGIVEPRGAIGLCRQHVNATSRQRPRDRCGNVNIQVERNAHSLPAARSRRRSGEPAD